MVSRLTLFSDIVKHLLRWFHDDQIHADAYHQLSELPRATCYQVILKPALGELSVSALSADTPTLNFTYPPDDAHQARRFSEVSSTAMQIVRLLGPRTGALSLRQSHLYDVFSRYLTRVVAERSVLSLHINTHNTGFHLGLSLKTSTMSRVIDNNAFEFTTESEGQDPLAAYDEYARNGLEPGGPFMQCFRIGRGQHNRLYLDSEEALEALTHQRGTLTLVNGFWPFIAFTGLFSDGGPNCAALALKTPHGWLVVLCSDQDTTTPYLCYRVPDVFGRRHHIQTDQRLDDVQLRRLLDAYAVDAIT